MIDPRTILLSMPCHDGRNMVETTGAIVAVGGRFAAFTGPAECSHPSLVRNIIADNFLRSDFKWLVCLDSDIYFSVRDWEYLMEPTVQATDPEPSRLELGGAQENAPTQWADALVSAEYAYKRDTFEPVKLGLGFTRIHRSVFETLINMKTGDGRQALWMGQKDGRKFYDFYPDGAYLSTIVPSSEWKGEDHGFFTMCMLAGIIPRIETRTRLTHIGRKGYPYLGPDAGEGQ